MSSAIAEIRPSASIITPKITYKDFLERYDGIRAEWVDGEVITRSPVSNVHQRIELFLARLISEFVEQHNLGRVFYAEFQMKSGSSLPGREPDLIFVSQSNLSLICRNFFEGPGDLVVKIVSPESIQRDRVTKFEEYQQAGVKEYWLIDPLTQQASFFQLDDAGRLHSIPPDAQGIYRSRELPGHWLKTDWLWQSPPPLLFAVRRELGLS